MVKPLAQFINVLSHGQPCTPITLFGVPRCYGNLPRELRQYKKCWQRVA
jgi:hypothetical protein